MGVLGLVGMRVGVGMGVSGDEVDSPEVGEEIVVCLVRWTRSVADEAAEVVEGGVLLVNHDWCCCDVLSANRCSVHRSTARMRQLLNFSSDVCTVCLSLIDET